VIRNVVVGRLRPGVDPAAVRSALDAVDVAAYRSYDAEAEHNRVRREMLDPLCEDIARVQFEA
jgi:hypothetical protein